MSEKAYSGKIPNTSVMSVTAPKKKESGRGKRTVHFVNAKLTGEKGKR